MSFLDGIFSRKKTKINNAAEVYSGVREQALARSAGRLAGGSGCRNQT
jgi:hypothetical protein